MAVLVDTRTVPPRERFACWHEAASKIFFPLRIALRPDRSPAEPFFGRVLGHHLGPIQAFRITGDPNTCLRTPSTIRQGDPEELQLYLVRRGVCRVGQADRASELVPGDLTTHDTSRPFTIDVVCDRADGPFELIVFNFPKYLLGPHADHIGARTALRIPGGTGLAAHVGPFLAGLLDGLDEGTVAESDALADSMVGLLRSLFDTGRPAAPGDPAALLRHRIHAYIEEHLADPALGPERIANAHFISVRYLHKLFRAEGITVSRFVQQRRLERCRRDLADPALAGCTIESICSSWGMTNPDHFSRVFRATYGCPPREWRARAVRARSDAVHAGEGPGGRARGR
ncbi:MAG TPA: helix-turn-helix domain-containing protein [Pseudonocardia sp.]|uniref:helix-turn-helix domain-containing protein n=1 Tax=Pseudonocardia sp. TaxID=60912 RepID=UPI002B4B865D|nr:helix-turn-helix domain-containing protein [Pseudonocardia sp.]HLU60628.1 helix-turn-helix domain-containing protein [Pseudonocardia sp.]